MDRIRANGPYRIKVERSISGVWKQTQKIKQKIEYLHKLVIERLNRSTLQKKPSLSTNYLQSSVA